MLNYILLLVGYHDLLTPSSLGSQIVFKFSLFCRNRNEHLLTFIPRINSSCRITNSCKFNLHLLTSNEVNIFNAYSNPNWSPLIVFCCLLLTCRALFEFFILLYMQNIHFSCLLFVFWFYFGDLKLNKNLKYIQRWNNWCTCETVCIW